MLCPQARRHSSIFHTFEALGLGWPGVLGGGLEMVWGWSGDGLGMVWGGLGWPGVPWGFAWHDFCTVSGLYPIPQLTG